MRRRTSATAPLAVGLAAALLAAIASVGLYTPGAPALPQYTAREGRNCENCHVEPSTWEDPPLLDRKCSMDCSMCHVDPTGGGLRNVGGYYYGIQTLPMFGATRQPWIDRLGSLTPAGTAHVEWASGEDWPDQPTPVPTSMPTSMPTGESLDEQDADIPIAAFGHPAGRPATNAFLQGRYGGFNADPAFRFGFDLRFATYASNGVLFFPMQGDLEVAVHPVEHLTLMVEGGIQGSRSDGVAGRVGPEEEDPFGLHEAFLMTHEWPGNFYLKAGRFVPPYGWRLDDHTAPVRRLLGFDQGRPSATVSGVEVGGVINYPYLNLAAFRLDAGQYDFWPDDANGSGVSGTAGWRDLAWGLGGSFYASSSDALDRQMVGAVWYFNPWRLSEDIPLTVLGEVDFVSLQPAGRDRVIQQLVAFHELDWRILAGLQLRLRYDFEDPDLDVRADVYHRLNLGIDFFPYRFTEIQLVGRLQVPEEGDEGVDFLGVLRAWY